MSAARLLAIFAHPDDESLLAGGTLARCAAVGVEAIVISATRGEQGPIAAPDLATRETLGGVREAELRAAGGILGLRAVECLGYADGMLRWADAAALDATLAARIRHWQPAAVLTFGPEGLYWHPDHIAIHARAVAALAGLRAAGCAPWLYYATWPAGLVERVIAAMGERGLVPALWGLDPRDFGAPAATITTTLDVSPLLATKMRALRSHRSQLTPDHLFRLVPEDLLADFLGREYFVRAWPADGAADWLARVVSGGREQMPARPNQSGHRSGGGGR